MTAPVSWRASAPAMLETAWRDPVDAASAFADEPYAVCLLSDGSPLGRWSYLLRRPARVLRVERSEGASAWARAAAMLEASPSPGEDAPGSPPFRGGLAGLAAYELGARTEPSVPARGHPDWPDLLAGLYPQLLAFDHRERRVLALGRGADAAQARASAAQALQWLETPARAQAAGRLAERFDAVTEPAAYCAAVADVVARIGAGEIFQANIARAWAGRLQGGTQPFDLFARLARHSPAPFAAYARFPGLAVVSNSPERFLAVDAQGRAETRPIKGTRPRGRDAQADAQLAQALLASAKDRAENLMIVDLMRNDLARGCIPGSVRVPALFALESFANVHHLVSTVTGRLAAGVGALELMATAFPPGSITGAPKVQAMRVIAGHEPPRGPYCGSLFWAGFDGALDSSVAIRTVALVQEAQGWRAEARAGAGVVADSDPAAECAETEAKIDAIRRALLQEG